MSIVLDSYVSFGSYMVFALLLLCLFTVVYVKATPYKEITLIKEGNVAAAISLVGVMFGYTLTLASTIYFTHSILEMVKWGVLTGVVHLMVVAILYKVLHVVKEGNVAFATLYAGTSVSVGLLSAACISY